MATHGSPAYPRAVKSSSASEGKIGGTESSTVALGLAPTSIGAYSSKNFFGRLLGQLDYISWPMQARSPNRTIRRLFAGFHSPGSQKTATNNRTRRPHRRQVRAVARLAPGEWREVLTPTLTQHALENEGKFTQASPNYEAHYEEVPLFVNNEPEVALLLRQLLIAQRLGESGSHFANRRHISSKMWNKMMHALNGNILSVTAGVLFLVWLSRTWFAVACLAGLVLPYPVTILVAFTCCHLLLVRCLLSMRRWQFLVSPQRTRRLPPRAERLAYYRRYVRRFRCRLDSAHIADPIGRIYSVSPIAKALLMLAFAPISPTGGTDHQFYTQSPRAKLSWETTLVLLFSLYLVYTKMQSFRFKRLRWASLQAYMPAGMLSTNSVGAAVISKTGKILLVQRLTREPAELYMTWTFAGGKVEKGESMEDAVIRELREEVGLNDISSENMMPIDVQSHTTDYVFTVFLVLVDGEPALKVPTSEETKLTNPTWFDRESLPSEIVTRNRETIDKAFRYFSANSIPAASDGREPTKPVSKTIWLDRNTHRVPPGMSVYLVNNRDNLCTWYAIASQVPPQDVKPFEWARANIPEGGYSPAQLVDTTKLSIGVYSSTEGRWTHGCSTDDILLLYTPSEHGGHYDGLRRSKDLGELISDVVVYPQGRMAHPGSITAPTAAGPDVADDPTSDVEEEEDENEAAVPEDLDLDDVSEASEEEEIPLEDEEVEEEQTIEEPPAKTGWSMLSAAYKWTEAAVSTLPSASNAEMSNGDQYWNWSWYVLSIKESVYQAYVLFNNRESLFRDLERKFNVTFSSPTDGLKNFLNYLRDGSVDMTSYVTKNVSAGRFTLYTKYHDNGTVNWTPIHMDTTWFGETHSLSMHNNIMPYSVPEGPHRQIKDLESMFACFRGSPEARNAASNAGRYLNSYTDYGRDGMEYIFERLVCGALAAEFGAVGRAPPQHGGRAREARDSREDDFCWFTDTLFPSDESLQYMMDARTLANMNAVQGGNLGANRPPRWFNPKTPGMAGATMLFNTSFSGFNTHPPVRGDRNFLGPLANYHKRFLGLRSPDNHRYTLGANNADMGMDSNLYLAPLKYHADDVPPLMLYSATSLPGVLDKASQGRAGLEFGNINALSIDCMSNPKSWLDAIAFILQHFGGADAFAIGCQNAFRRSGRFVSPKVTMMPTVPIERMFEQLRAERSILCLAKRLAVMRIFRPTFDPTFAHRNDPTTYGVIRAANAVNVAGPALHTSSIIAGRADDPQNPPDQDAVDKALQQLDIARSLFPNVTEDSFYSDIGSAADHPWPNVYDNAMSVDYTWHQYFSQVDLFGGGDAALIGFMRGMTSSETNNLQAWLGTNFYERWQHAWPAASGFPDAAEDLRVLQPTLGGRVFATLDDMFDGIGEGIHWGREQSLPTYNILENANITVPPGLSMLRSLRVSHDLYHTDNAALQAYGDLLNTDGTVFAHRFAAYASLMRACADQVSHSMHLNSAQLNKKIGVRQTGNGLLDTELYNSTERAEVGGMSEFMDTFVKRTSDLFLGCGLPSSVGPDYQTGYMRAQFYPSYHFNYQDTEDKLNKSDALLIWAALHPLHVQYLIPGSITHGAILARELIGYSTRVMARSLPWTFWAISSASFLPTEVFSAIRVAFTMIGINMKMRAVIRYQDAMGAASTSDYLLPDIVGGVPARRSDQFPFAPTTSQDPLLWYRPVYRYFLDAHLDEHNQRSYMVAMPNFMFSSRPKFTILAPPVCLNNNKARWSALGAKRGYVRDDVYGTQGNKFGLNPVLAGAFSDGNAARNDVYSDAWVPTRLGNSLLPWLHNQASANVSRMRGVPAYNAALAAGQGLTVTSALELPPTNEVAEANRTQSTAWTNVPLLGERKNVLSFAVPYGAPTPANETGLDHYISELPRIYQLLSTLAYKPWVELPLVMLGARTDEQVASRMSNFDANAPFRGEQSIADATQKLLPGLDGIIVPLNDPQRSRREMTFQDNQLVSVPTETFDMRHIRTAMPTGDRSVLELTSQGDHKYNPPPSNLDGLMSVYESGYSKKPTLPDQLIRDAVAERRAYAIKRAGLNSKAERPAKKAIVQESSPPSPPQTPKVKTKTLPKAVEPPRVAAPIKKVTMRTVAADPPVQPKPNRKPAPPAKGVHPTGAAPAVHKPIQRAKRAQTTRPSQKEKGRVVNTLLPAFL